MISLSESLLTAASRLGLGAVAARAEAPPEPEPERRNPSSEPVTPDDPLFLAVAEALQEAGYLDS
ncbi:hypothetical protein HNR00_000741 [Methylorubrum rhodinum]|jgi:hypothetical protein|uniref:Uncharacterized protein n=1 Tax=Methylorubrum rhodinum TaxID=29428 RepID=A0A840ZFT9_9HYPH|nr:hypothetical protein [Methylorubrum rhodinum]MBB5756045.1 hypothetical protein [Methylorubrum rhodinum]